LEEAELHWCF